MISGSERKVIVDKRVGNIYKLMTLLGVIIMAKILFVQYGPEGEQLRSQSLTISHDTAILEAFRGDIFTHDMRLLATSVPEYDIRMDFATEGLKREVFMANVDSLSRCLASFFGDRTADEYRNFLTNRYNNSSKTQYRYVRISPRRVSYLEMKEIAEFPIFNLGANRGGFIAEEIYLRLRPYGSLARRTIGFNNSTGTKLGLEGAFDTELKGVDGKTLMQKISGNIKVPIADEQNRSSIDGSDVITTIDANIQDVAETALREQLLKGGADWGCAILMEVATGEIRAITNLTRYDDQLIEDYNYAMGTSLEPGSTIKLATLIALLEEGASLDEIYKTNGGSIRIGAATVRDSHDVGTVTLKEAFEQSSNIAFALAANKHFENREQEYVDYIRKMGLGEDLQMQIPGEAKSIIYSPEDKRIWNKTTLTNMAYGYALRLTPLHTLCLYNAIANNGTMVRPRLVTMLKHHGDTVAQFPVSNMVDNICSPRTVELAQQCLENVVNNGTGRMLQNPQYSVAAKTGTAQIAQGRSGYTDAQGGRHYLASLAGYFPADDPKYSCIVVIKTYNSPRNRRTYYGAALAGPVFKAIAERVYYSSVDWQPPLTPVMGTTQSVKGINNETSELCHELNVRSADRGRGITEYRKSITNLKDTIAIMPELSGLGLKDALFLLESKGLKVNFSGSGAVVSQSHNAGDTVARNSYIDIILSNREERDKNRRL